jgi:hypothetical protein
MCRFKLTDGTLRFEEGEHVRLDGRYRLQDLSEDNSAGITISPDSKLVCQVFPGAQLSKTPVYPADTFQKHHCTLDHGLRRGYLPGRQRRILLYPPLAMGFDLPGRYIYTQGGDQALMVCTLTGVVKKEYKVGITTIRQFLVHPGGNQVVLLRGGPAFAPRSPGTPPGPERIGDMLLIADSVLVELPKKK